MNYSEVILQNRSRASVNWWPHYAYHYTDVRNAVSILESGNLYSRTYAEAENVMANDNASRQVIDRTSPETYSFVRFYFRPLTPTQYHNEGFKHTELRYDGDFNANVPVPVFFFFYLDRLLSDPDTCFSEGSEAGKGSPVLRGEKAFSTLNFEMIYRNGPYLSKNAEEKKREGSYRQSEILYPQVYSIEDSLAGVVCRNAEERMTLLNLLKDKSRQVFDYWQSRIKVFNKNVYYNNGLYVDECSLHTSDFSITFSDDYPRKRYANNRDGDYQINSSVSFEWMNQNNVLYRKDFEWKLNYFDAKPFIFRELPEVENAQELSVKISFDGHLMCYQRYSLLKGEY